MFLERKQTKNAVLFRLKFWNFFHQRRELNFDIPHFWKTALSPLGCYANNRTGCKRQQHPNKHLWFSLKKSSQVNLGTFLTPSEKSPGRKESKSQLYHSPWCSGEGELLNSWLTKTLLVLSCTEAVGLPRLDVAHAEWFYWQASFLVGKSKGFLSCL